MKLLGGKRCRTLILFTLVIFICGVIYFGYFCPDQVCALSLGSPTPQYKTPLEAYLKGELPHQDFAEDHLERDYNFNIEGEDVIVFLHMQKTGGTTFGRHLVRNIQLPKPCVCYRGRKRCDCYNSQKNIWLFSRYSTGWMCGLHADWTELQACVSDVLDKRESFKRRRRYRYLYITILRDPVMRFLSEWKHVQRGSTWLAAKLRCNGRSATLEEVPFCFTTADWSDVTLDEFLNCPYNLANNRLTRMLTNLSLVGCYNFSAMSPKQRDSIMLESAKENLRNMAFFGLTEYQRATQYMFEHTFKLKFIEDFVQRNVTHAAETKLTDEQRKKVLEVNRLDIELYQYAKDLFFQRLHYMQEEDARHNVTNRLLLPPSEEALNDNKLPEKPQRGDRANDDLQVSPRSRRRKGRRRHKFRTAEEVALQVQEQEQEILIPKHMGQGVRTSQYDKEEAKTPQGGPGGHLVPLNHLPSEGQFSRQYPLSGRSEAEQQRGAPSDSDPQNPQQSSTAHLDHQRQAGLPHLKNPPDPGDKDYVP